MRGALVAVFLAVASAAAAQCDPSARATFAAGIDALSSGELRAAAAAFQQVVRAQPNCAEAHNNLGVTLFELGQLDAAAEQFRRAIELRPSYQRARLNLAHLQLLAATPPLAAAINTPAAVVTAATATPTMTTAPVPSVTAGVAVPPTVAAATAASYVAHLEQDARAAVVDRLRKRICLLRGGAAGEATACYPIQATRVEMWPQWLLTGGTYAQRIRLVDAQGARRIKVVPGNAGVLGDIIRVAPGDFAALSEQVVEGRTLWLATADTPSLAPVSDSDGVRAALDRWHHAWEQKNLPAYTAMYAATFVPQGEPDVAAWHARKAALFAHAGTISIRLSDVAVFALGTDRALTAFDQRYASAGSTVHDFKVLEWARDANDWRITREMVIPPARSQ